MEKTSKIYIAGHTGLVGSALLRHLKGKGYTNFVFTPYPEFDLINQAQVEAFFAKEKPEYVFVAAAKVGGIVANNTYRGQFIYENIQIQNNIIHYSYVHQVKKLLFLGSSCIYPKACPQPIKEDYLLTDILEYTNEPYAIAKIAGIKMCESYNIQYGTNFISVMPTNLYGYNDNFDLEKSHVLPALIRKMYLGKCLQEGHWDALVRDLNKRPIEGVSGEASEQEILAILGKYGITSTQIELWGTGAPLREFLHSDDLADACVFLMENIDSKELMAGKTEIRNTHINIGSQKESTIKALAELIQSIVGYTGIIYWNTDKPDGTMRKIMDNSKLVGLGWKEKVSFKAGITKVFQTYIQE